MGEIRQALIGDNVIQEDLASMRVFLEDQLVQKKAVRESIILKISQLENQVSLWHHPSLLCVALHCDPSSDSSQSCTSSSQL